ncbi:MAG: DNA topoisomerase VI subunit B [Phycisphaerae bacterium]
MPTTQGRTAASSRSAKRYSAPPPTAKPAPKPARKPPAAETAETMSGRQKEIAVSEFFAKNRHLLGFDNPRKALLTTVKEAVDNCLDACEEAGILPEVWVTIEALNAGAKAGKGIKGSRDQGIKGKKKEAALIEDAAEGEQQAELAIGNATRFRVTVRDNGPGIVKAQVPNVFGRLLYGSKFHRLRMSRGQQGIGISAAGMYGLLTTGQAVEIVSKPGPRAKALKLHLAMDTLKNRPDIHHEEQLEEWLGGDGEKIKTGTAVSIVLEAKFQRGRASVDEYLEQTAIANPHAAIHYVAPDGVRRDFPREVNEVPDAPDEIKPHPYGVELGVLIRMLKETQHSKLSGFLQNEFSRVTGRVVNEICRQTKVNPESWCKSIDRENVDELHKAIQNTKIQAPPTDCLVPIGPQQILKGIMKEIKAEFYTAETREPAVYRGNPFQIEVGIAFGGDLPKDEGARVIRFANRVPLLYQPSACCITKSVQQINWRNYGLSQPRGGLPEGPLVVFVHMASVWVPFTSESKEAIADYDDIRKEIGLALKECGRKLNTYIRRRQRIARESSRRDVFQKYIREVVAACSKMTKVEEDKLLAELQAIAKARTQTADLQFDEDGNPIKPPPGGPGGGNGRLDKDDNVVIVESAVAETKDEGPARRDTGGDDDDGGDGELFPEDRAA